MSRSCVMQLFQGQTDPAWCQSRLKNGLVQPYSRLYNGSWIFAAMTEQVPVLLECPDGSSTPTGLVGFGVIQLAEGCTITSDEFWYSHTFAGMVEVNVGFGSDEEDEDLDSEVLGSDYDINNFQDDVMFQTYEDLAETTTYDDLLDNSNESDDALIVENNDIIDSLEEAALVTTEDPNDHGSKQDETASREQEIINSGGLNVENPGGESATQIYKDLLVKLKDKLSNNWIQIL